MQLNIHISYFSINQIIRNILKIYLNNLLKLGIGFHLSLTIIISYFYFTI